MLPVKKIILPIRYIRTTLPDFVINEMFSGQARVELTAEAVLRVPDKGYDFSTPHMINCLYLEMGQELAENDFSNILFIVDAYARTYHMEERFGYSEKLKEEVLTENEGEIVKANEIVLGDDFEFDEEMKGEEFEQGEISEDFREEEYDGFHLEMRLLLFGDKRERDVSKKVLRMRDHYIAAMAQKGGMPSRIIPGREGRKKMQLVTKDFKGMSVYKEGDNLGIFLREFEEHAFRREWSTRTMLEQVAGLGECNEVIDEIALECLGWLDFKAGMWAKYVDLTRDEIEDDIIFDGTNLEDFEDSINLCSEKRRWGERKIMEQVMRRIAPREYEAVKRIKEESDTKGSFLVKMRKTYSLEVQKQKKKLLLQEQGLWIDKKGERIERRAQKEDRGNIAAPL
ncbi:hypothetical protein CBR_g29874 [Chara braunii]|uniref:Uncharacterized protein n=1 Tax=Chara braunii TaxID=69332 RepID=A0A388JWT8_CHABU|nr:hypothetical protein CBR_g29874 [Chara braunii]|eukprot:GBG62266.1 hypothetical protein CBR_g29874 [Chara braunii]